MPGSHRLFLLIIAEVEQIVQDEVILQADRQAEGQRVDPGGLFADHHPVAVVEFAGAAVFSPMFSA